MLTKGRPTFKKTKSVSNSWNCAQVCLAPVGNNNCIETQAGGWCWKRSYHGSMATYKVFPWELQRVSAADNSDLLAVDADVLVVLNPIAHSWFSIQWLVQLTNTWHFKDAQVTSQQYISPSFGKDGTEHGASGFLTTSTNRHSFDFCMSVGP